MSNQYQKNYKYQQKGGGKPGAPGEGQGENATGANNAAGGAGAKYIPKNRPQYQKKGANNQGGNNQNNYYQKGQGQKGGYQKGENRPYAQKQGMGGKPQGGQDIQNFFPHQQNLQNMDQSEVQELLVNVLSMYGTDIASMSGQQAQGGGQPIGEAGAMQGLQSLLGQLKGQEPQGRMGGQQNYNQRGAQGSYRGGYQKQNNYKNYNQGSQQNSNQSFMGAGAGGMQSQPNLFQNLMDGTSSMPAPVTPSTEESKMSDTGEIKDGVDPNALMNTALQQQQNLMNSNICEIHFPEPIIFHMGDKALCKKCIPIYLEDMKKKSKSVAKDSEKPEDKQQQQVMVAQMLGLTSFGLNNLYNSEKNLINKCLLKLDDFKGDFRYIQDEIEERAQESNDNLENLPELLCQTFDQSKKTIDQHKEYFLHQLEEVITKQQQSFMNDNEVKVPTFYDRLSQKYSQLQQATSIADQISQDELIEILNQYLKIFLDLDAEFEKYFNEFENVSKLQRLLDKDQGEIITDFNNLIESNLRVDYNIKNSFHPGVPSRVHSFQWNQKYAYVFKVHNSEFEKRPVQMEFEVPLYSRSIATEDGGIYLIGGCNKRRNQYLKKCYRYNEIFGNMDEKSSMIFPHADHSLCAIEGFIYVVGTFVNSQVYPFCEVYDIQKDQWRQIDSLRVARSGVALSSFKNNYIFAFGGRIDQKNIVDTIECYDISKNVWQEITGPTIDKTAWIPGYMSLSYQITDNEIIIFGGKSALTQQIFNGCFVFDVQSMEIKEKGKLVNPCSFMNTPLVFGGHLYAFGNDIYIHKYNIADQKWACIPKAFP